MAMSLYTFILKSFCMNILKSLKRNMLTPQSTNFSVKIVLIVFLTAYNNNVTNSSVISHMIGIQA